MMFRQLHFGRDEPILEPEIPIVDAGHHLFVRPGIRYLLDDYLDDVRAGHRIVASVYIETNSFARQDGPEVMRPLGEIEFANGVGAMSASGVFGDRRICAGIVGYGDLRLGDDVAAFSIAQCSSRLTAFAVSGKRRIITRAMLHTAICRGGHHVVCFLTPHFGRALVIWRRAVSASTPGCSITSCPISPPSRMLFRKRPSSLTIAVWRSGWIWTPRAAPKCSRSGATRCGKSREGQTSCARSAGWACRSGASASRIVPTRSGARGDLGALRPDGHRDFRSRSLLDGERLSRRKPLVWLCAPLERAQVHRPLSHLGGESRTLPRHRRAGLSHSPARAHGCRAVLGR